MKRRVDVQHDLARHRRPSPRPHGWLNPSHRVPQPGPHRFVELMQHPRLDVTPASGPMAPTRTRRRAPGVLRCRCRPHRHRRASTSSVIELCPDHGPGLVHRSTALPLTANDRARDSPRTLPEHETGISHDPVVNPFHHRRNRATAPPHAGALLDSDSGRFATPESLVRWATTRTGTDPPDHAREGSER